MQTSMFPLAIVALLCATFAVEAFDPRDFVTARQALLAVPPDKMNYTNFCLGRLSFGDDKTGCRIKSVPTVGLLVCHDPDAAGRTCKNLIVQEIHDLNTIKSGGVEVVAFDPEPVQPLKCARESYDPKRPCTGYLVSWVDPTAGWFESLSQVFKKSGREVEKLIAKCRKQITAAGLKTTAVSLNKIKMFMEWPSTKYRHICDLQGFFLNTGGYNVSDPQGIVEKVKIDQSCWNDTVFPTTQQVLSGLERMIADFKKKTIT